MKPRSAAAARKAERPGESVFDMAASSSTKAGANLRQALGLMSGTSLDGIDVAAIATDGVRRGIARPGLTGPFPEPFRRRGGGGPAAGPARGRGPGGGGGGGGGGERRDREGPPPPPPPPPPSSNPPPPR